MTSAGRPDLERTDRQPERLGAARGWPGGAPSAVLTTLGIARGGPGEQGGQAHLVPEVQVVVGSRAVGAQAHAHPAVEQRGQRRHPRTQLPVGAGAMGDRDVVRRQQPEVVVVEPHRVGGQDPPVEHPSEASSAGALMP